MGADGDKAHEVQSCRVTISISPTANNVLNNHKGIDLSGNAAALARDLKTGLELDWLVRRHCGPARTQGRRC
jgi:hypothetical protein